MDFEDAVEEVFGHDAAEVVNYVVDLDVEE